MTTIVPPRSGAVHLCVRYRPIEYIGFAIAHALDTDTFVRAAPRWQQRLFSILLAGIAAMTFVWKSLRMGRCDFMIDAHGIERRSRRGASCVPWSRVQAVHMYPQGYLIELAAGAVPLPYRVMQPAARQQFEALAGPRLRPGRESF